MINVYYSTRYSTEYNSQKMRFSLAKDLSVERNHSIPYKTIVQVLEETLLEYVYVYIPVQKYRNHTNSVSKSVLVVERVQLSSTPSVP